MAAAGLLMLFISIFRTYAFPWIPKQLMLMESSDPKDVSEIKGRVLEIDRNAENIKMLIDSDKAGRLMVYAPAEGQPEVYEGNIIAVSGRYRLYEPPGNPGQFDLKKYYGIRHIYGSMYSENISILNSRSCKIRLFRRNVIEKVETVFQTVYPAELSGIMCRMILGAGDNTDDDLKELYSRCGIAHILAISGLHIAFAGRLVYGLCRKVTGEKRSYIVSLLMIGLYVFMTGASSASVRALIYYAVRKLGDVICRTPDHISTFFLAFGIMTMINPRLIADAGFLMSFAAAGAMTFLPDMVIDPENDRFFQNIQKGKADKTRMNIKRVLRGFTGTVLLQLVLIPLMLNYYYVYSPLSILLNLLVLPGMGIVLGSGFVTAIGGMISVNIARITAVPGIYMLNAYTKMCRIIDSLSHGGIIAGKPGKTEFMLYYLLLAVILILIRKTILMIEESIASRYGRIRRPLLLISIKEVIKRIGIYVTASALLTVLILSLMFTKNKQAFTMTVLDVGQGDCICLEADGSCIVVDCGSSDNKGVAEYRLVPFLKSRGIKRINALFISHPDNDHISGIYELLEKEDHFGITIDQLIMTKRSASGEECAELTRMAAASGTDVKTVSSGDLIMPGQSANTEGRNEKFCITCLYPDGTEHAEETEGNNDDSMILKAEYGSFKVMLTGDLEMRGESVLLSSEQDLRSTVLKVAHHGSGGSSSEEFLEEVMPDIAVISCGKNNRYGHPNEETLVRLENTGAMVKRTDTDGAVFVKTDGKKLRVSTFLR